MLLMTRDQDAEELRYKETDRISLLTHQLRLFEIDVEEQPDGFQILGNPPYVGAQSNAQNDHRLGMALAVLGLSTTSTSEVLGAEIIKESFPGFVSLLASLGANMQLNDS